MREKRIGNVNKKDFRCFDADIKAWMIESGKLVGWIEQADARNVVEFSRLLMSF